MVGVEVVLQNAVEIYNVPSIPNLGDWSDQNILALQEVYDMLRARRLCLDGLEMYATNLEFRPPGENGPVLHATGEDPKKGRK
jgi:hypothetical protein